MDPDNTGQLYRIWGVDRVVYGPVELPGLVDWLKDGRVLASTWVFREESDEWRKAGELPELKMFFHKPSQPASPASVARDFDRASAAKIKPGALRRVRMLADLSDTQLEQFAAYMEVQPVRQWAEIVKIGDAGDAMYLILEGELRVRLMVSGKESILATLLPGDFFGEIALFDSGPRSADVVANKDSTLLRIAAESFGRLVTSQPELAAPILFALGKTLTARIRADNKRYRDSVAFARSAAPR